jgi:hypothetical protein
VCTSLGGDTPADICGVAVIRKADPHQFRWQSHYHCLFELPIAA